MTDEPDDDRTYVVVHFVRLPGGELRCRVVDAVTKIAWLVPSAKALHRLIFATAPHELTTRELRERPELSNDDEP
jgi:hypothetical protein